MDKRIRNRKAVSPVIATLLMIAIAVAASVVMYSWVNTMVTNQAKQSQTAIRIDNVQFHSETPELDFWSTANATWVTDPKSGAAQGRVAELYQSGSDDYAFVRVYPTTTITLNTLSETNMPTFKYYMTTSCQPPALELRFEDPLSDGYVDVTVFAYHTVTPVWPKTGGIWYDTANYDLTMGHYAVAYGLKSDGSTPIANFTGSNPLSAIKTQINALDASAANWVLTRVSPQVGGEPVQTVYIDDIKVGSVTYYLEEYNFIKVSIRNTGTVGAVIKTIYVYKQDTLLQTFSGTEAFSAGELRDITVVMTTDLQTATAYNIKAVTDIGFSMEGTYYTPNTF